MVHHTIMDGCSQGKFILTFADQNKAKIKRKFGHNFGDNFVLTLTLIRRGGETHMPQINYFSGTKCRIYLKPGCRSIEEHSYSALFQQRSPKISLAGSI